MIDEATLRSFQRVGKELCMRNLNTSHSGNISMRTGGRVIIKKRAAMLYWLEAEDLISVSLDEDDSACLLASTELDVHRRNLSAHRCDGSYSCPLPLHHGSKHD